jgi:hypothetical protein
MRRKALAALIRLAVAAVPVISLAGCGGSASNHPSASESTTSARSSGSASSGLTVSPRTGGQMTTFTLSLTAPTSSRNLAHVRIGYTLSVTGPAGQGGCIAARSVGVPSASKGTPVSIALNPARLGDNWCVGTYTARAVEIESPICAPGTMCPAFIRVVGAVGEATFRVLRSG